MSPRVAKNIFGSGSGRLSRQRTDLWPLNARRRSFSVKLVSTARFLRYPDGITHCKQLLVPKGEFRKGFVLISINQFNIEQERVIILGSKCYWRIKYNFDVKQVERYEETPLSSITHIERGRFRYPKLSLTKLLDMGASKQYGIRIHHKAVAVDGVMLDSERVGTRASANPFKKVQPMRTFRALDCVSYEFGKDIIKDLCDSFTEAVSKACPDSTFYVSDSTLVRNDYIGPLSAVLNAWQVGHYNKDVVDDSDDEWMGSDLPEELLTKKAQEKERKRVERAEQKAAAEAGIEQGTAALKEDGVQTDDEVTETGEAVTGNPEMEALKEEAEAEPEEDCGL